MKKLHINIIRWLARILGVLLGLGIFLFGIISRFQNPSYWIQRGQSHFVFWVPPILLLASFIIAWSREALGGLMIIGFWALILALGLWGAEPFWGFTVGLLHLFCWWQSRKLTLQAPSKNVSK